MTDCAILEEQRDTLTAFAISELRGLIATTVDSKVKLDAIKELNAILSLTSKRSPPVGAKQTNNFYGSTPRRVAERVIGRLDATRAAVASTDAAAATAAELASLDRGGDDDD
jgi:hypothetical protein